MMTSELDLDLLCFVFSQSDLAVTNTVYLFVLPVIADNNGFLHALVLIRTGVWSSEI